jgi:tetratricopeptide (TPR) repeat protein
MSYAKTTVVRAFALSLTCLLAWPANFSHAQKFEGLGSKKKSGKKAPRKKVPASTDTKEKEVEEEVKTDVPLPEGGVDMGKKPADAKTATPAADPKPAETKPADAKAPVVDKGPGGAMNFDAVDVSGKTGDRQKLEVAISQFRAESYEGAALSFSDIVQDPKYAAIAPEASYWLAKSLYKLGLYHSSLTQFSKVLARGQTTKFFKSSLEWLFFISRKTVNETVVLDEIAKYANFDFPDRFKNEYRYLLARYNFVRGRALDDAEQKGEADKSFEEVKRLVSLVPKGDAFYPRAKYLEGICFFRDNKPEAALESMKEVVRMTRVGQGPMTSDARNQLKLRELAFMQLARTHYGARQNRNAIFYFQKIERGGPQWLESLFESSWASYRIGQSEQSLGNLITLSSPFFRDEYFPESLILKAVIYFENCRYREALTIIEDFEQIYGPVQEQLDALVQKNMEATEYFNVLDETRKKNRGVATKNLGSADDILERILNLALTDQDLKKAVESISELEAEIDSYGTKSDSFKFSNLTKSLIEELKGQREQLIKKAGVMAKGKLEFENGQLKLLRGNGLRIKFETTTKEKEYLQAQLAAGGATDIVKNYKYSVAVSDDQLYWPYVGEYWRDELGTYQYTLTKGCIDRESGSVKRAE